MAQNIEICSFLMGSSKTNKIIQWMKNQPSEKFIYVIPNLSELVDSDDNPSRILSIGFITPELSTEHKTKSEALLSLLKQGANIACTQSLYKMLSKVHLDIIKSSQYNIILDEELSLIDVYEQASTSDLVSLLNDGKVKINEEDGMVEWCANDAVTRPYQDNKHKHHLFYKHIVSEYIYAGRCVIEDGVYQKVIMVSQITKELVACAKRLVVITYLFKGSILDAFLKIKGFNIIKFEDIGIVEPALEEVVGRINLLPYESKFNKLKLNSTWWKNASKEDVASIGRYIRRIADTYGGDRDLVMWTCPSGRVKTEAKAGTVNFVAPKGYLIDSKGNKIWLGCSVRATNKYAHKKLAIHCFNRYPHTVIDSYLRDHGAKIDEDVYAISELLQWVFRSNCRLPDGSVTLAIASKRMYDLYVDWTKGRFKDEF